jgi:NAD(P)-dependent dehydrogenase (short-subunit alcohol dehydrogenase family)
MKVVIGYLDEQHIGDALKQFPDHDPRIHAIKHDVMDRDAWERTADEIEKKFGGLQVLVSNAGVGLQTNIGKSESYRPAALKNDGPPAVAPGAQPRPAPGAGGPPARPVVLPQ